MKNKELVIITDANSDFDSAFLLDEHEMRATDFAALEKQVNKAGHYLDRYPIRGNKSQLVQRIAAIVQEVCGDVEIDEDSVKVRVGLR